jgi:hypothetical protein
LASNFAGNSFKFQTLTNDEDPNALMTFSNKISTEANQNTHQFSLQVKSMDLTNKTIVKQIQSPQYIMNSGCSQSRSLSGGSGNREESKTRVIKSSNKSSLLIKGGGRDGESKPSKHEYLDQFINSHKNSQNIKGNFSDQDEGT